MSMGTLGKAMKATRTQMIESEAEIMSQEFTRRFGMRDGDYLRFKKNGSEWKQARIMSVDCVFFNQRGGFTAEVTIAPLLVGGRLGKTRCLFLAINANGSGLRGVHHNVSEVARVSERREAFV